MKSFVGLLWLWISQCLSIQTDMSRFLRSWTWSSWCVHELLPIHKTLGLWRSPFAIISNGDHTYRYIRGKTVTPAAKQHDMPRHSMPRHSVKPMALSDLSTLGDSNFKSKSLDSVHRHLVGEKVGIPCLWLHLFLWLAVSVSMCLSWFLSVSVCVYVSWSL